MLKTPGSRWLLVLAVAVAGCSNSESAGKDAALPDAPVVADTDSGSQDDASDSAVAPTDDAADGSGDSTDGHASNAKTCTETADCKTGTCVDGYCCDNICTGTCKACNVPGFEGICTNVPAGQNDLVATTTCVAPKACNGAGICRGGKGQNCAVATACALGFCVDKAGGTGKVCCDTACDGATEACGADGVCKMKNAEVCNEAADCASGFCVDGTCCNTACADTCKSCNLTGSVGTCSAVPVGEPDDSCAADEGCTIDSVCKKKSGGVCTAADACATGFCADMVNGTSKVCCNSECTDGALICSPAGQCKKKNGESCNVATGATSCASGFCVDGFCCDTACTGTCMSCSAGSGAGKCSTTQLSTDPVTCVSPNHCAGTACVAP